MRAGVVAAKGLISQGDGQIFAVRIFHHTGNFLGLAMFLSGLLRLGRAQQCFGQGNGGMGERFIFVFNDRYISRIITHAIACQSYIAGHADLLGNAKYSVSYGCYYALSKVKRQ